jgi:hypothetical protein
LTSTTNRPFNDDEMLGSCMKNSLFLNNLEGWIDEVISRNGLADEALVKQLKSSFQRSIQANVEYHLAMGKDAKGTKADRHRIMAKVYQELLPTAN